MQEEGIREAGVGARTLKQEQVHHTWGTTWTQDLSDPRGQLEEKQRGHESTTFMTTWTMVKTSVLFSMT